jgi:hypothetical protein
MFPGDDPVPEEPSGSRIFVPSGSGFSAAVRRNSASSAGGMGSGFG